MPRSPWPDPPARAVEGPGRAGWLAGQKLPPVAWLIADDHPALNGALDQLITGGGAGDRRPRQARYPDPEPSQTHNGVIGVLPATRSAGMLRAPIRRYTGDRRSDHYPPAV
jgi:hypothetical protein